MSCGARIGGPGGSPPVPPGGGAAHVVRPGETLSQIARRHGVFLADMLRANPQIRDPNQIRPGQEIRIPAPRSGPPAGEPTPPTAPGPADRFERSDPAQASSPFGSSGAVPSASDRLIQNLQSRLSTTEVRGLEQGLNEWRGANGRPPIRENGQYDRETLSAVLDFQRSNGLADDGIPGRATKFRLMVETDPSFRNLNHATKEEVRALMNAHPRDDDMLTSTWQVATTPEFAQVSRQTQHEMLGLIRRSGGSANAANGLQSLLQNQGFARLSPRHQRESLEMLERGGASPLPARNLNALLGDPTFAGRSDADKTRLIGELGLGGRVRPLPGSVQESRGAGAAATPNLTADAAFRALPANCQQALTTAMNNPVDRGHLQQLLANPLYTRLDTGQRERLLTVFAAATTNGRIALPRLMDREIQTGSGRPAPMTPALLSQDVRGQSTLLEQLSNLATRPLHGSVSSQRATILDDALRETADPGMMLDQGTGGFCSPATISGNLLMRSPAEYVRIAGGLLSPERRAVLADGTHLPPAVGDIGVAQAMVTNAVQGGGTQQIADTRSIPERVVQSALLQLGRQRLGEQGQFNPNTQPASLNDAAAPLVYGAIYDRPHEHTGVGGNASIPGSQMAQRRELYSSIENEIRTGRGPVQATLLWSAGGRHAVMVTAIEEGRVYFRNPWGAGISGSDGALATGSPPNPGPIRVVVDANSALEAMSLEEFQRHLAAVIVSR